MSRWFDQSFEIFLTDNLKDAALSYRDYPLFWWNSVVIEPFGDSRAMAEKICEHLPCPGRGPGDLDLLKSWAADTALRRDHPGESELQHLATTVMYRATLPVNHELLELLRQDPMQETEAYTRQIEMRLGQDFARQGNTLLDPESGRTLVPVKLAFPPSETAKTLEIQRKIDQVCEERGCPGAALLGSHAGTMENEMRIREDAGAVSAAGSVALILLVAFILWSRRNGLLKLLPLLGVATAAAAALTVAVFGSIHAISLSFGPGLIGLAMDFGIHAAFLDPRSKATWRSNFMALLTSLVIMVLLGFSSIPLLKQMMFFAVTGLILSYALFYFIMRRWPEKFQVEPLGLTPPAWRPMQGLAVILALSAALIILQPLKLGLEHMNYETPVTKELREWFHQKTGALAPYHLPEKPGLKAWAGGRNIRYEGAANLLPPVEEQEKHLRTWREPCAQGLFKDENTRKFFAPFEQAVCGNLKPRDLSVDAPVYLQDFTDGRRWIAVLRPSTPTQVQAIEEFYPQARSPRELIKEFPRAFAGELQWMLPVSLAGAFLFLLIYYRRPIPAAVACLPFASGVGCFALMTFALGLPVTFISLMGLLMVFGFSIDFGIFAVDSRAHGQDGVWSALTLCAVSTLAGFAPMAMGQHPVLNSLGHALLWGSAGTYAGAFWGVPFLYRRAA